MPADGRQTDRPGMDPHAGLLPQNRHPNRPMNFVPFAFILPALTTTLLSFSICHNKGRRNPSVGFRFRWTDGWYGLPSFRFLGVTSLNRLKSSVGLEYASPAMMALANLLSHPEIGTARIESGPMAGLLRAAKDLGRVIALARLAGRDEAERWLASWRAALELCFPDDWKKLAVRLGDGLKELLGGRERPGRCLQDDRCRAIEWHGCHNDDVTRFRRTSSDGRDRSACGHSKGWIDSQSGSLVRAKFVVQIVAHAAGRNLGDQLRRPSLFPPHNSIDTSTAGITNRGIAPPGGRPLTTTSVAAKSANPSRASRPPMASRRHPARKPTTTRAMPRNSTWTGGGCLNGFGGPSPTMMITTNPINSKPVTRADQRSPGKIQAAIFDFPKQVVVLFAPTLRADESISVVVVGMVR